MADETAVADPSEQQVLKNFGDLGEVFDKVFPSTAKKKEAEEAPAEVPAEIKQTKVEPEVSTTPAKPVESKPARAETGPKDELPDFLTGKKTEEPKPSEPEIPPPAAKESVGMKQLRTAYENLKKTLAEKETSYTTQIETLKQAPPVAPDAEATIKNLEDKLQQLSSAVERQGVEFHPAFKAEFTDRREQMVNDAHEVLKEAGIDPMSWDRAMSLTGANRTEALEEIYSDLPKSVVSELGSAAREIRALDSRRDAYLANSKDLRERLQRDDMQRHHLAMREHEKNTLHLLDSAEHDLVERLGLEVYKKSDNPEHQKWNESVDKMKSDAKKLLLETTDPSVMAAAALLAPAALQYRYLYHTMRERWLESEKRNKEYEKAEPTSETRGTTQTPSAQDKKLKFADAVAKSVFGR